MMMEAIRSSETSALPRATRRNITEEGSLHSHRRENLKSYIALTGWTLRYELGVYVPEDGILHSHRRKNLKYYLDLYLYCSRTLVFQLAQSKLLTQKS
jgi:hypothetical protein